MKYGPKPKPFEPDIRKEQDPFIAGWDACYRYMTSDWGPSPPSTPEKAKLVWQKECDLGHYNCREKGHMIYVRNK